MTARYRLRITRAKASQSSVSAADKHRKTTINELCGLLPIVPLEFRFAASADHRLPS